MLKLFPHHQPPTITPPKRNYHSASSFYLLLLGSLRISSSANIKSGRSLNKLEVRPFLFESELIRMEIERIGIRKIVCGQHLFFLLNDGTAYGNGSNEYSQLMNGKIGSEQQLEKVILSNICDIYCGDACTYCLVKENGQFAMYFSGYIGNNQVISSNLNKGDSYCKLNRVLYLEGDMEQSFPPPNEIVLDLKCTNAQLAILTMDNSNPTSKYLYFTGIIEGISTIGSQKKYLQRKKLSEQFQFAEVLFFRRARLFFTTRDGKAFDIGHSPSKYKMVSYLFGLQENGQLVALDDHATIPLLNDICFDSIALRRRMMAISSDTRDVYVEKDSSLTIVKIELENYMEKIDRKKYLSNRSNFNVQIASTDDIGLILVTKNEDPTKFRNLLCKYPSDLSFYFQDN